MRITLRVLIILLVTFYTIVLMVVCKKTHEGFLTYKKFSQRMQMVASIKPKIDALKEDVWKAISAYDVGKDRAVNFEGIKDREFFDDCDKVISSVSAEAGSEEAVKKFDLLSRSLKVLRKKIDYIKSQSPADSKNEDDDILAIARTANGDSGAYVDRMQKEMEGIRFCVNLTSTNIDSAIAAEMLSLNVLNDKMLMQSVKDKQFTAFCVIVGIVFGLFVAGLTFRKIL